MSDVLTPDSLAEVLAGLTDANRHFSAAHPGDKPDRQPVHTVYGGAHLVSADLSRKLGAAAIRLFEAYAPDPATFARAIGLSTAPLAVSSETAKPPAMM